ncbi:MAG: hypothetical protein AMXMBFR80_01320 [Dehalococcoidia bacterium]|nr:hypothetical protein [Tepidiformaceae bacterium]
MTPGRTCQVGGRFSRCHNPAEHVCQYCGGAFCSVHTDYIADHEAVCSRKQCHAKRVDLEAHLAYKARVIQRNRAGLCGIEGCGPHPGFECSLCLGLFCGRHLHERHYPFQEGRVQVERLVSVCAHCWERRKIWRAR